MPWSTREIAELSGTTVNTVRHYHVSGLLEEPDRTSNRYKQYGARHLARILQIMRLRDLGVPLSQIETVGLDGKSPALPLLAIDADLAASVEGIQRARAEIRLIMDGSTSTDVPTGFEGVASKLSDKSRSLVLVYARLYDESAMADVKRMIELEPEDASAAFQVLPEDADDDTRRMVAETLAPVMAQQLVDYPWVLEPAEHLSNSPRVTRETFIEVIVELYNEAQLDVLGRASVLAHAQVEAAKRYDAGTDSWGTRDGIRHDESTRPTFL